MLAGVLLVVKVFLLVMFIVVLEESVVAVKIVVVELVSSFRIGSNIVVLLIVMVVE